MPETLRRAHQIGSDEKRYEGGQSGEKADSALKKARQPNKSEHAHYFRRKYRYIEIIEYGIRL